MPSRPNFHVESYQNREYISTNTTGQRVSVLSKTWQTDVYLDFLWGFIWVYAEDSSAKCETLMRSILTKTGTSRKYLRTWLTTLLVVYSRQMNKSLVILFDLENFTMLISCFWLVRSAGCASGGQGCTTPVHTESSLRNNQSVYARNLRLVYLHLFTLAWRWTGACCARSLYDWGLFRNPRWKISFPWLAKHLTEVTNTAITSGHFHIQASVLKSSSIK